MTGATTPAGSMLVLPGGGYRMHADHEAEPVAEWLTSLGWRARVVRYPLDTEHPGPLDAVRAEIAAERDDGATVVGVLGFSAGGHLAGHAALAPGSTPRQRPDLAVLGYPVVSMVPGTDGGSGHVLLGADPSDELRRSTSLELLVTAQAPPVFVWHTADDEMVPVGAHSYRLGAALAEAGVPHELHVLPHGRHGLGLAPGHPAGVWTELCAAWLRSLSGSVTSPTGPAAP